MRRPVLLALPALVVACSDPPTGYEPAGTTTNGESSSGEQPGTTGTSTSSGSETGGESSGEPTTSGSTTAPVPDPVCGNGFVEEGEPCDDANDDPDDGCNKLCERTGVPIWTLSWDGGIKQDDSSSGLAADADGNLYVSGTIENDDNYSDAVIRKLDPDGEEIDRFVYAGGLGLDDGGNAVAVRADGSVVLAGYELVGMDGPVQGFVRLFSPDGATLWDHTMPATFAGGDLSFHSIAVEGDAVYVAGTDEVEMNVYATVVRRLDAADGMEAWTMVKPDSTGYSAPAIALAPNGELLLAASFLDAQDAAHPLVVRYAADGEELWERSDYGEGVANGVAVHDDGSVAIVGRLFDPITGADWWVARLEPDGTVTWSETYDRDNQYDTALSVVWTEAGDLYVTGYVYVENEQSNVWVERRTGAGEVYWTSIYNDSIDLYEAVRGVAVLDDRVVVAGTETASGMGDNQWIRAYMP